MFAGALSSKACISSRPVAFTAPKASVPRMVARKAVVAETEAEEASAKRAKAANLRTEFATNDAIDAEVQKLKADMFVMRIKFAKREAYRPAQYTATRKRIAQLLTIRRERDIEQGVDRRAARAAEKRLLVEAGLGQF
ncbi:hypothetical protein Ndes2437B_g02271 [Nannochloris sp. 'desiccata']